MEIPLVNKEYLLEKTPGKGGWTYAAIPEELSLCLQDEPEALRFFNSLNENEQHNYVKWIYSTKTDQTKVERIVRTLDRLTKNQKYYDKE